MSDFYAVVEPHLPELRRAAWRYARACDGEDLLQGALEKAFRARASYDGRSAGAWLHRILRNHAITVARAAVVRRAYTDAYAAEPPPEPLSAESDSAARDAAVRALSSLIPQYRSVVEASAAGRTYAEIAQDLQIPIGTVMSRLSRGRRILRAELSQIASDYGLSVTS